MNTFSKALIAATITLGAVSAQAAQGELYQFDGTQTAAPTITASSAFEFRFDERGLHDKAVTSTADRATVKAMIKDAGGLLSLPRA
jgi:hypothetical protein